jgi:hypothetical protein
MIALLADIGFGRHGTSADHVIDGWGDIEGGHRWSIGQQSTLRLPPIPPDCRAILVLDFKPWTDPACLPEQTLMVGLDDRLVASLVLSDQRVLAIQLPDSVARGVPCILSFSHPNSRTPRPAAGLYADGQPLGFMVSSVRLFSMALPAAMPVACAAIPGTLADGLLVRNVEAATGLSPSALVTRFESIGHDCEYGTVQRAFGEEPLGLLRFAGVVTHKLVDGLMARFAGIGAPQTTRIFVAETPKWEFKVHEQNYYLWYSVGKTPDETTQAAVHAEQTRRLAFLRRKFLEDLQDGQKIFVLTRGEILSEAEALAVFCALNMEGANTLLWITHSDPSRTGQVDRLLPGFLHGHLGAVDERNYGTLDAWLSLLANAYVLNSDRLALAAARSPRQSGVGESRHP